MNSIFLKYRVIVYLLFLISLITSVGFIVEDRVNYGTDLIGGYVFEIHGIDNNQEKDLKDYLNHSQYKYRYEKIRDGYVSITFNIHSKLNVNVLYNYLLSKYHFADISVNSMVPSVQNLNKKLLLLTLAIFILFLFIYSVIIFNIKYSIIVLIKMFYDGIVIFCIYNLLGFVIDIPTVAAFLMLVSYSIYDLIIVLDSMYSAIRKEEITITSKDKLIDIINRSILSILDRSINTSVIVLIPLIGLILVSYAFNLDVIVLSLSLLIFIGIIVSTFSSIFLSPALLFNLNNKYDR